MADPRGNDDTTEEIMMNIIQVATEQHADDNNQLQGEDELQYLMNFVDNNPDAYDNTEEVYIYV